MTRLYIRSRLSTRSSTQFHIIRKSFVNLTFLRIKNFGRYSQSIFFSLFCVLFVLCKFLFPRFNSTVAFFFRYFSRWILVKNRSFGLIGRGSSGRSGASANQRESTKTQQSETFPNRQKRHSPTRLSLKYEPQRDSPKPKRALIKRTVMIEFNPYIIYTLDNKFLT